MTQLKLNQKRLSCISLNILTKVLGSFEDTFLDERSNETPTIFSTSDKENVSTTSVVDSQPIVVQQRFFS